MILAAVHVPERTLIAHSNWETWHLHDIVTTRTNGRNPFSTAGVQYTGGAALNEAVARCTVNADAVAIMAADADSMGQIPVPVMTLHAIDDPTAFVEREKTFRRTIERAGRGAGLVQLFTQDREHSYLTDAQCVSAMHALQRWVEQGARPTPQGVASVCAQLAAAHDPANGVALRPRTHRRR